MRKPSTTTTTVLCVHYIAECIFRKRGMLRIWWHKQDPPLLREINSTSSSYFKRCRKFSSLKCRIGNEHTYGKARHAPAFGRVYFSTERHEIHQPKVFIFIIVGHDKDETNVYVHTPGQFFSQQYPVYTTLSLTPHYRPNYNPNPTNHNINLQTQWQWITSYYDTILSGVTQPDCAGAPQKIVWIGRCVWGW